MWCDVDLQNTSILEIHFPVKSLVINPVVNFTENTIKQLIIDSTPESTAQLLALAVDHIDILLEDWYPTLGTRFVHTSEGKFLITRLIPCPQCLIKASEIENNPNEFNHPHNMFDDGGDFNNYNLRRVRKSQESYTSECDSGVGPDSNDSSRLPSMEGYPNVQSDDSNNSNNNQIFYSWMVEECILAAYSTRTVTCPIHNDVPLSRIAPDTVSNDFFITPF